MNTQFKSRFKVLPFFVATIAMVVVITGWATDRYTLNAKIQEFEFSIGKQSLVEYYRPLECKWYESESETTVTGVTKEELALCPTWDARAGDPPISARDAISLANAAASKLRIYDEKNWQFRNIALSQLCAGENVNKSHWCWRAYFEGSPRGRSIRSCEIWVLLDGSVITPKVVQK